MTEPTPRARRDMRSDLRFPDDWTPLPFMRRFTAAEFERMAFGLIPRDMDDRWFVYLEGDTFYFHWDWTGFCVFRMKLKGMGEEFVVAEAAICQYPPPWWQIWKRLQGSRQKVADRGTSEPTAWLKLIVDVGLLGKPDPRLPDRPPAASEG